MGDYIQRPDGLTHDNMKQLSFDKMSIERVTKLATLYTEGLEEHLIKDLVMRVSNQDWMNYTYNNPVIFEDIIAHFYTNINCDYMPLYRTMHVYQEILINFILHNIPGRIAYIEYSKGHYLVRIDDMHTQVQL